MKKLDKETIIVKLNDSKISYRSSQKRLCLPIINRIYRKMRIGIRFPKIKIDNNLICDGHHRYIASILANTDIEVTESFRSNATEEIEWALVEFDENDWDSPFKINSLNLSDAHYNNISPETLMELLNKL